MREPITNTSSIEDNEPKITIMKRVGVNSELVMIFPTSDSKNFFLKAMRKYPQNEAKCFAEDDKISTAIIIPLTLDQEGKAIPHFSDLVNTIKFFNRLPELTKQLDVTSFVTPKINIDIRTLPDFKIPLPDFVKSYEKICVCKNFPPTLDQKILYVKTNKNLTTITFKSTSILIPITVSNTNCNRIRMAMVTDDLKLNFKNKAPVYLRSDSNTFNTILTICDLPAFTQQNPSQALFGPTRRPPLKKRLFNVLSQIPYSRGPVR